MKQDLQKQQAEQIIKDYCRKQLSEFMDVSIPDIQIDLDRLLKPFKLVLIEIEDYLDEGYKDSWESIKNELIDNLDYILKKAEVE